MDRIADYDSARNYPAVDGTSHLSVHLRFGTVSVRQLVRAVRRLIAQWRGRRRRGGVAVGTDLARVLCHDPVSPSRTWSAQAFKPAYDAHRSGKPDRKRKQLFPAWCEAAPAIRWSTRPCGS